MPIETQNLHIIISCQKQEAMVLLKRELYLSDIISDVEYELSRVNFRGMVVFDMLLTMGMNNHYFNMWFDNQVFDYNSNSLLPTTTIEVENVSRGYYQTHPELLIHSSLTPKQKNTIISWLNNK